MSHDFSAMLSSAMDRRQYADARENNDDDDSHQVMPGEAGRTEDDDGSPRDTATNSAASITEGRADLLHHMALRFLSGAETAHFDYSTVDGDDTLDVATRDADDDAEEAWFGGDGDDAAGDGADNNHEQQHQQPPADEQMVDERGVDGAGDEGRREEEKADSGAEADVR